MRVIVAPDSYKGSISALGVADAMEKGIYKVFPDAEVLKIPIADGGEGTVEALITSTGGEIRRQLVTGPLGKPVKACWGILGDGKTAIIEMAAASGLPLVTEETRDPRITTTFGTGELMKEAMDLGLRKLVIGIGGSATNDGGTGMAKALGARFLDNEGRELPDGGAALANLAKIDLAGLNSRLSETTIIVACDVDNPLCGSQGASVTYGLQKGATPEIIDELENSLYNFARIATRETGRDVAEYPGAGAAGGLGAGLMFFTNAKLRPGIEIVLETTDFASKVSSVDVVITGEGSTDFQTAYGKAPVGIAKVAKQFNVPVICLSGSLGTGYEDLESEGIYGFMSIVSRPMELRECMRYGKELVEAATERVFRQLKIGMDIKSKN